MAWTQAQLDTIEAAIAQGATSVEYDGKKVEYRSLTDMMRVRDLMRKSLGQTGSTRIFTEHSKGFKQ